LLGSVGGSDVEFVIVTTAGDRRSDAPIWEIGGKGVFVKEVQAAVLDGRADIAVHSAKDLPAGTPAGLALAAVPELADPRDAWVGSTLADLPVGGQVATGSVRRRAQLAYLRPDLTFAGLRGNIDTRLEKASRYAAIVMAAAALDRLGKTGVPGERLDVSVMVPQVAQGALAVECRADDTSTLDRVTSIDDAAAHAAVACERAFLAELGGDCDVPIGAYAVAANGAIRLSSILASLDGHVLLRDDREGSDPDALGRAAARFLLDDAGGGDL